MALVLADRVKETTTTAGTGTITLDGAATGFQSFAVIGNSNTTFYTIAGQTGNQWEVGIGTYSPLFYQIVLAHNLQRWIFLLAPKMCL